MAHEIELKLTLANESVSAFRQDPQLGEPSVGTHVLDNQYFDTPDLALNRAQAALRIRKTPSHYVQTLKSKGTAIAGLHQRGEWEHPIEQPILDWQLVPEEARPAADIRDQVKPLFKTDFERTTWMVRRGDSDIELVLDTGEIRQAEKSKPLTEIELELKQGNPRDLFELAIELAERYPLMPCDINKAERGYQLVDNQLSFYEPYAPTKDNLDVLQLISDALARLSRAWDQFVYTHNWWMLVVIEHQVAAILSTLEALKPDTALYASWLDVQRQLTDLLADAQVVIGIHVDRNTNSKGLSQRILKVQQHDLEQKLAALLKINAMGRACLRLGRWLYDQVETWQPPEHDHARNQLLAGINHQRAQLSVLDPNQLDEQLNMLPQVQALAYLTARMQLTNRQALSDYIDQLLIVAGMRKAEQLLPSLQDGDSRAKLASWTRRLTVELRALQDYLKPLQVQ